MGGSNDKCTAECLIAGSAQFVFAVAATITDIWAEPMVRRVRNVLMEEVMGVQRFEWCWCIRAWEGTYVQDK